MGLDESRGATEEGLLELLRYSPALLGSVKFDG